MSLAPRASRGALAVSLCRFALAARAPPQPPPPPLAPPPPRGAAAPWLWLLASLALVLVAGTMAGLTVGLLGMDPIELELKKESEDPQTPAQRADRDRARAVWSVVSKHHWLLCTLLFVNAGANEALPLCLNELLPPYAVITVSVTLVVLFGEILPTAIFTGPRRLRIAAHCVPATRAMMWLTAPISFPMSLALDRAIGVGHHGETRLDRRQIGTLIGLHRRARRRGGGPPSAPPDDDSDAERALLGGGGADGSADASSSRPRPLGRFFVPRRFFVSSPAERGGAGGPSSSSSSSRVPPRRSLGHRHAASFPALAASDRFPASASDSPPPRCGSLSEDEVQIVRQTLALSSKTVADAMTPLRSVKMLSQLDVVFDEDTLASTLGTGLSRIPVHRGGDVHNVVGVLMVRKLIVLDPNERRALRDVPLRAPLVAHPDAGLLETLNAFQAGRSHLALVTRHGARLRRAWREGRDVRPGSVEVLGVITVEDIVEELLGEEIRDEAEYGAELTHDGDDAREEERPRRRFGAGARNEAFEPTTPPEGGLRRETSPGEDDEPGDDETRARTSRLARGGSPYRLPAVRKAARKFKLLAERGRARRLQRSPSAESLAESLVSLRSLPATPRGAP